MFRLVAALSVLCVVSGTLVESNGNEDRVVNFPYQISIQQNTTLAESNGKEDRVVNGRRATINEHPYQVSIQQDGRHFCGGSIITPFWILTAAHCVVDIIRNNQVSSCFIRAGSSTYNSGGVLKPVEIMIAHELYNPKNMLYDAALAKIQGTFTYSASIKPIRLLNQPLPSGVPVTVSGWGQLGDTNTNLPINLNALEMTFLRPADCNSMHRGAILDSMVCAYGPGKDACRGDSGGPLSAILDNIIYLIGIVSWGIRCAEAGLPGVYCDPTNPIIRGFIERYVGRLP